MNDEIRKYALLADVNFKTRNSDINNKQAFFQKIRELAKIIPDEDWTYTSHKTCHDEEYGILYRYLTHMYEKLKADGLILFTQKPDSNGKIWMYWHTGLFDTEYDDMIFVAQKYANSKYPTFYFSKFEKRSVIAK